MSIANYFPIWDKLDEEDQERLERVSVKRTVEKGTTIHRAATDCIGLLLVESGQLRAYMASDEGKEITLYRLFEQDICLFSASCIMRSIQFDISIEAEKETTFWIIPPNVYHEIMEESAVLANYTSQIMATRFSEVMWLVEQVMWKSMDKRLADFLIEESNLEDSMSLKITHEKIANHMGTAREVITRMLKYFQREGMVSLTRGTIEILDFDKLYNL